jgi:hypothetical protein
MPAPLPTLNPPLPPSKAPRSERFQGLPLAFLLTLGGLSLAFVLPLVAWVRFGLQSDLFSYTLLVPVVSVYLFLTGNRNETGQALGPLRSLGVIFAVACPDHGVTSQLPTSTPREGGMMRIDPALV